MALQMKFKKSTIIRYLALTEEFVDGIQIFLRGELYDENKTYSYDDLDMVEHVVKQRYEDAVAQFEQIRNPRKRKRKRKNTEG
jgi:hypothetical protein